MTDRTPKESALLQSFSDLIGDFADLFQKELQLAKAEIISNITRKLQAGLWIIAAAFFAVVAALLVVQAIVFALIEWGLAPYWACLVTALGFACIVGLALLKGKADAARGLAPKRAINQIKQDIKSTKEQLS